MNSSKSNDSYNPNQHIVEPFRKNFKDDELDALARMILNHSLNGWEIVAASGDEIERPYFVFKRVEDPRIIPRYTIERLQLNAGEDVFSVIKDRIWQRVVENWVPACVLDAVTSRPILVYRKSLDPLREIDFRLVDIPVTPFENPLTLITNELINQQVENNLSLACVVHARLNPTLVMVSKQKRIPYQYLVESADSGIFNIESSALAKLISERSMGGWEVCGMFEDATMIPCVIFRRNAAISMAA